MKICTIINGYYAKGVIVKKNENSDIWVRRQAGEMDNK